MTAAHAVRRPLIVGIGGSTRSQSSGELALRHCLRIAQQSGTLTELIAAQDLQVPMYDPASTEPDPRVARIIDLVHRADALVIASPAYHGGISGLVKNILDHLEALSFASPPYLEGKAVGCITTSRGAQGGASTLAALRSVVHALRGWPTPLGVVIDTSLPAFGPDNEFVREDARDQLHIMTTQMVAAATSNLLRNSQINQEVHCD